MTGSREQVYLPVYEYIMDRIDIPDTPPYIARFYEPEIREVLNAPLE